MRTVPTNKTDNAKRTEGHLAHGNMDNLQQTKRQRQTDRLKGAMWDLTDKATLARTDRTGKKATAEIDFMRTSRTCHPYGGNRNHHQNSA